jgi:sialidase-1
MPRLLSLALAAGGLLSFFSAATSAEPSPVETDVFTAGQEGYHTYRIPALLVTQKGTLLLFCEGRKTSRGDHGDVDLVLKRSSDGGKTWGPLELVYEEGGADKVTIGNPCPVVDQESGVIWLPFCRENRDVLVTHSADDGRTWARPKDITAAVKEADWGWYATGPGNGIQLARGPHKGRLVIPCDHRVAGKEDWSQAGRSHVFYSDDHGASWKLGGVTDWAMNECAVVELADGSLMLNMRNFRGQARRGVATSKDGGQTWSAVKDDPALVEPVCQASLIRFTLADTGGKDRLLFSNPAHEKGRKEMTVRLSYDEGQSWPVAKLIHAGPSAYSSLAALPGGDAGLVYERDGYKTLSFVRLSLAWLTDGGDSVK